MVICIQLTYYIRLKWEYLTANHDRPKIFIVFRMLRTVDNNRTGHSINRLSRVVSMVPSGAIRIGLESICKGGSGSYWALCNSWNTIVVRCLLHREAMPMHGCSFGRSLDPVVNSDLDDVSPICFDKWARVSIVDQNSIFLEPIGSYLATRDSEVVVSNFARIRWIGVGIAVKRCPLSPWLAVREWIIAKE